MKRSFFQAVVVSILLYWCNTWTLTKRMEKKLDGNYTRMLEATPNKAPTIRPPTSNKTCRNLLEKQGRAHKWCSPMDPLIWPSKNRTTSSNLHTATLWGYGCSTEDLPEAMNDRKEWRERDKDIRAGATTWWWLLLIILCVCLCVCVCVCVCVCACFFFWSLFG